MKLLQTISLLNSLKFLNNENRVLIATKLKTLSMARKVTLCIRKTDPIRGSAMLKLVNEELCIIRRALWAANVTLALSAGDAELAKYYVEHEVTRKFYIPVADWIGSVATILLELRWLGALDASSRYIAGAAIKHYNHYQYAGLPEQKGSGSTGESLRFDYHEEASPLVSLEVVASMPSEVLATPELTERSVAELQAAALGDQDLSKYISEIIKDPLQDRFLLGCSLGWSEKRLKAVDRRYRRLRAKIKASGAGQELKFYHPFGMGSCNSYFEVLYGGTHGCEVGTWAHKPVTPAGIDEV